MSFQFVHSVIGSSSLSIGSSLPLRQEAPLHLVLLQPIEEGFFGQLVHALLFIRRQVLCFSHKPSI